MAAALLEMSCAATVKKDVQKRSLTDTMKAMEAVRKHCLFLATEDMRAYAEVVRAAKSKKEFPDLYEAVMKSATDTLVSIVKNCESILKQTEEVVGHCYAKVLGDIAGSAYMAEAAAGASKQGVEVNLRLLRDEHYKNEVLGIVRESCQNCSEAKNRILAAMAASPDR